MWLNLHKEANSDETCQDAEKGIPLNDNMDQ